MTRLLLRPCATVLSVPSSHPVRCGCRVTGRYPDGAEYVAGLFPAALQGKFAQVSAAHALLRRGRPAATVAAATGTFVLPILLTACCCLLLPAAATDRSMTRGAGVRRIVAHVRTGLYGQHLVLGQQHAG